MKGCYTNIKLGDNAKKEINEALKNLLELGQVYQVPLYACVVTENSENGTIYDSVVLNASSHEVELKDDKIRRHMLIADGFDAVPPRENVSINMANVLGLK